MLRTTVSDLFRKNSEEITKDKCKFAQAAHEVDRVTPASSRDSLSVTSFATEVSGDVCTRSSVASQAICEKTTFLGEIQLILSYDIRSACFCVHVIQCRSLPHFGSHRPNPYVKVLLVPRDSSATVLKKKTTPRKADADPVFDQILKVNRTLPFLFSSLSSFVPVVMG
ncbi:C2 domain protein [Necator americanus]|uniref:C2 domain protein n=1 Tax=Necator americanus TaxID=51031 RepID=W2TWW5_NECAM|nr:C2 domain protein [Necator americanus]ETN85517.1 C2 domain protein [Necator americanus]